MRLPQIEANSAPARTPSVTPPKQAGPRAARKAVLVVDDNADAAELLALALQMMGHETETAHTGREALHRAAQRPFDAAFLDIGLPEMDGYELVAKMRLSGSPAPTLLFALTGYGQPSDLERSRAAGFDRHLVKPVDLETIEKLLDG